MRENFILINFGHVVGTVGHAKACHTGIRIIFFRFKKAAGNSILCTLAHRLLCLPLAFLRQMWRTWRTPTGKVADVRTF